MKLSQLVGALRRPVWFPLAFRFGLKVEQISWDEAAREAATLAYVVRSVHQLLSSDVLVGPADTTLLAEACGAPVIRDPWGQALAMATPARPSAPTGVTARSPMGTVLQAVAQLCQEAGGRVPVVGCLTGPGTLARQLFGTHRLTPQQQDYLATLLGSVTRAYAEVGVGGVVVVEELAKDVALILEGPCLDVARNVAGFYAIPLLLICGEGLDTQTGQRARQSGFAYAAGSNLLALPVAGSPWAPPVQPAGAGLPPHSTASGVSARPHATGLAAPPEHAIITTCGEIPADAEPDPWTQLATQLTRGR